MRPLVLNEFGFLPVPPPCHEVSRCDLPGVFGNGHQRNELWQGVNAFFDFVCTHTSIREVYLDGDYISANDPSGYVEVGIELFDGITRAELEALKAPFDEEWDVCVNWYAPRRPDQHNFHEAFQRVDPHVSRFGLPKDLRKGYLRVRL
jgi:hypothetical protein